MDILKNYITEAFQRNFTHWMFTEYLLKPGSMVGTRYTAKDRKDAILGLEELTLSVC